VVQVQHLLVTLDHRDLVQHSAHLPQPLEVAAVDHTRTTVLLHQADQVVVVAAA
jgi:hypothetical protein